MKSQNLIKLVKPVIIVFYLLFVCLIFAETTTTITDIEVQGLKRTNPIVVKNLLKAYINRDADKINTDEIIALLVATGIFENVTVSVKENTNQTVLFISLEEKWSIIPLPLVSIKSDSYVFGLGFFDANAFGLNHKLFSSASVSSKGPSIALGYIINSLWQSKWDGVFSISYATKDETFTDVYEHEISTSDITSFSATISGNYSILNILKWDFGFEYQTKSYTDEQDTDLTSLGLQTGITLQSNAHWNGVFLTMSGVQFYYTWYYGIEGPSYGVFLTKGSYETAPVKNLKLSFRSVGLWGPQTPQLAEIGANKLGLIILPDTYTVYTMATFRSGLELKLFSSGIVTFAGLAHYHIGYSEGSRTEPHIDYGPSFGLRLYLAKVALPAMDINIAYNQTTGLYQASFSIGMQM
ncbi:hypothetical protein [Gracilinema caldarium]|uniref:POTRA domain-containing protein n=1 Tax=Gracilinema caldarium (strain ATCC 51460 / DSM 7334 / H1) TaxID=744872 RepID=F8F492_GRAC1|nr:hypothetical protein [Gracilinema caldarium]AEJ20539.1 hypothetical protein Spica_2430 [Gracilinema caldarium DSM 7334]